MTLRTWISSLNVTRRPSFTHERRSKVGLAPSTKTSPETQAPFPAKGSLLRLGEAPMKFNKGFPFIKPLSGLRLLVVRVGLQLLGGLPTYHVFAPIGLPDSWTCTSALILRFE